MTDFNKNEVFLDHPYNDAEKLLEKKTGEKKGYNTVEKMSDTGTGYSKKTEVTTFFSGSIQPFSVGESGETYTLYPFDISDSFLSQTFNDFPTSLTFSFEHDGIEYNEKLERRSGGNQCIVKYTGRRVNVMFGVAETTAELIDGHNSYIAFRGSLIDEIKDPLTNVKLVYVNEEVTASEDFAKAVLSAEGINAGFVVDVDARTLEFSKTYQQIDEEFYNDYYGNIYARYKNNLYPITSWVDDDLGVVYGFRYIDLEPGSMTEYTVYLSSDNTVYEKSTDLLEKFVDTNYITYDTLPYTLSFDYAAEGIVKDLLSACFGETRDTIIRIKNSDYSLSYNPDKIAYDIYHYVKTEFAECTTIGGRDPDTNEPKKAHYIYFANAMGEMIRVTCGLNYNNRYANLTIDYYTAS